MTPYYQRDGVTLYLGDAREGRRFVGVEIDPTWAEYSAKRLDRLLSEPRLPFVEERCPETQGELFGESA